MVTDRRYLMIIIAMCGLAAGAAGLLVNTGGVFYTPIADDLGVGRGDVSLMMTILSFSAAASGLLVPKILRTLKFRLIILIFTVIMVGGTILMAMSTRLWHLYVLCALRGLSCGVIGFVMVSIVLNNWFIEKLGLVTSICLGFSGVAGAVFSPIITGVIGSFGWRAGFLFLAVMMTLTSLPALLLPVTLTPEEAGMKQYGYDRGAKKDSIVVDREAVKKPSGIFFAVCAGYALCSSLLSAFPPHLPGYAVSVGLSAGAGALMLSASMIANIAGKLMIGALSDRIGGLKTLLLTLAMIMAALITVRLNPGSAILMVCAFLIGLGYAAAAVGRVIVTKDLFGREMYGHIYPTINFFGTASYAVAGTLFGFLYDASGSYNSSFVLMMVILCTAALILVFGYTRKGKNAQSAV